MAVAIPLIAAAISAAGSAGAAYLNRPRQPRQPAETQTQRNKRELVDQLLASIRGQGPYSDLFQANEATFQKSFVDPAKARFKNQIAPQIQQEFIASGQQRGSGLDDTLTRAGVDLDNLLNEHYMKYQQGALDRKQSAMNSILGADTGYQQQPRQDMGNAAIQGLTGYASGRGFGQDINAILNSFRDNQSESIQDTYRQPRRGFENEPQYYDPYSGVMQ